MLGVLLLGACGQAGPGEAVSVDAQPSATVTAADSLAGPVATAGSGGSVVASGTAAPATQPSIVANLPALEVVDVATGASHSLASLIATDRPTLLWMWAPH